MSWTDKMPFSLYWWVAWCCGMIYKLTMKNWFYYSTLYRRYMHTYCLTKNMGHKHSTVNDEVLTHFIFHRFNGRIRKNILSTYYTVTDRHFWGLCRLIYLRTHVNSLPSSTHRMTSLLSNSSTIYNSDWWLGISYKYYSLWSTTKSHK